MFAIKSVLCVARWLRLVVDYTIAEFCDTHYACSSGRRWALANCQSMQDVWNNAKPEWLIWVATRQGVLTAKELQLFAVAEARRVQHLMHDPRSVAAVDVAERYANGRATAAELAAAADAAEKAAAQLCDTNASLPGEMAWAVAAGFGECAADMAAFGLSKDGVNNATRLAAKAAVRTAQAAWLRENTKPDFTRK
jgi:hypothetical protein